MSINDQKSISGNPTSIQFGKERGFKGRVNNQIRSLPKKSLKKEISNNHKTKRNR